MNKGLWIAMSLLVLAGAWLVGINVLSKPATSTDTSAAEIDTNSNNKLMVSLESFKGFHHDSYSYHDFFTFLHHQCVIGR